MDTRFFGRRLPGGYFMILDREAYPEGVVWWVSSTAAGTLDAAGNGTHPSTPFATLVYAVAAASAGDTILVMPKHTETLTGNPSLTISLAGLRIIGTGGRTRKPIFLIDGAATAHVHITGADVLLENLTFSAGHADVAKAINVAAKGVEIRRCRFIENVTTENFLICVLLGGTNVADQTIVEGCEAIQPDTANTHFLSSPNAQDSCVVRNNILFGDWGTAAFGAATAQTNMFLFNNEVVNASNDCTVAQDLMILVSSLPT